MDMWNIQEVYSRGFASVDISLFAPLQHESASIQLERHWISWESPKKLTSAPDSLVTNLKSLEGLRLVKDRGKTPLLGTFQANALACFPALKSALCCQFDLEEILLWHTENNRWRKVGGVYDNSPHPLYKVHSRQLIRTKYSCDFNSDLLINITRMVLSWKDERSVHHFVTVLRN